MVRTSKRIKPDKKVNEPTFFRVVIYTRVSVEEKVSWGTVESQELMGKEYIQKHPDIELGKINCVIVKDISRFGRDYLATLEYIAEMGKISEAAELQRKRLL